MLGCRIKIVDDNGKELFSGSRGRWLDDSPRLRQQIVDGWAQFDRDLAAYALPPAAEPVQAEPMESLPAVSVRLDGALSVAGNLPTFAEALKAFIARMPAKPATDNEFATVEAACKSLKKAEDALDAAEDLFTRDRAEVGPALDGVGSGETFEAVQKYSKAAHACRGLAGTP